MASCTNPRKAYRPPEGRIQFIEAKGGRDAVPIEIPCGQCINCRLGISNSWKVRQVLHAQRFEHNQFITLTYSDDHLPAAGSLDRKAIPGFMKRLRDHLARGGRSLGKDDPLGYFGCGEYGENSTRRAHYHLTTFNLPLPDAVPWRTADSGKLSYRSEFLERCWPFGHVECAPATPDTMGYCAGYVVKKLSGAAADAEYVRPDPVTGEVVSIEPPFALMSRAPAIGKPWYDHWRSDFASGAFVMIDGKREPVPPYFMRKLKDDDPALFERLAQEREQHGVDNRATILRESAPERLAVKDEIARLKTSRRARDLGGL